MLIEKFAWSAKLRIADVGRLERLDKADLERLRQSVERDRTIAELQHLAAELHAEDMAGAPWTEVDEQAPRHGAARAKRHTAGMPHSWYSVGIARMSSPSEKTDIAH